MSFKGNHPYSLVPDLSRHEHRPVKRRVHVSHVRVSHGENTKSSRPPAEQPQAARLGKKHNATDNVLLRDNGYARPLPLVQWLKRRRPSLETVSHWHGVSLPRHEDEARNSRTSKR